MTERPILFSAAMVRAILEGKKTQTRRAIKHFDGSCYAKDPNQVRWQFFCRRDHPSPKAWADKWFAYERRSGATALPVYGVRCPYGTKGDRLWVRETFRVEEGNRYTYRADGESPGGWRSPYGMTRAASRLTLEVERIRVNRLWDIGADAEAEGIGPCPHQGVAIALYRELWNSINGKRAWDANPWVWVVTFKRA